MSALQRILLVHGDDAVAGDGDGDPGAHGGVAHLAADTRAAGARARHDLPGVDEERRRHLPLTRGHRGRA